MRLQKMPKRILGIAAFVLLILPVALSLSSTANAQGLKVGYTDHELIIVNMPEYRTVQEQLQREYQGGQQELQGLVEEYQQQVERYQRQQALLSPENRQEREQALAQLQNQLQTRAQQKEQELEDRNAQLMRPLFERVQDAIDHVSSQHGLDLVLRTQVNMQPVILYVNENTVVDITMDVARRLGLDVEADTAATGN
jgi:outer membrane protein